MNFKSILAAALITIAGTAHAEPPRGPKGVPMPSTFATERNDVGGLIQLQTQACPAEGGPGTMYAISTGPDHDDLIGCWWLDTSTHQAHIKWYASDGMHLRTYSMNNFVLTRDAQAWVSDK